MIFSTDTPAIAIDLGTSKSCVAVFHDNRVQLIPNDQGNPFTPTCIAQTTAGDLLVGEAAWSQATLNPRGTAVEMKRLLGRKFNDSRVHEDMRRWSFPVCSQDSQAAIQLSNQPMTPEQLLSFLLKKLKDSAEDFLKRKVRHAVITIPGHYCHSQRLALKSAAQSAGFTSIRLLAETTAAGISFTQRRPGAKERTVLVFDMGGGRVDAALLTLDGEVVEVIAGAGDSHVGGIDLDERLLQHFVTEFQHRHKQDLSGNARAMRRLRSACERVKRTLSSAEQASLELDSLVEGVDFYSSISRARFEELSAEVWSKVMAPVEKVLRDAKLDKGRVEEIVLVGGCTRIPKIQSLLSTFFSSKPLCLSLNPDEAVVHGAALYAAFLSGNIVSEGLLCLEAIPVALGIEGEGGVMVPLVLRNTNVPADRSLIFTPATGNQSQAAIRVFEGDSTLTKYNFHLGTFVLPGITSSARVKITFMVDEEGMFTVSASDLTSGRTACFKPGDTCNVAGNGALKLVEADSNATVAIEKARQDLQSFAQSMKDSLLTSNPNNLPEAQRKDFERVLDEALRWSDGRGGGSVQEYRERRKELEEMRGLIEGDEECGCFSYFL